MAAGKMRMLTMIRYSSNSHLEGIYSAQGPCDGHINISTRWFTDAMK